MQTSHSIQSHVQMAHLGTRHLGSGPIFKLRLILNEFNLDTNHIHRALSLHIGGWIATSTTSEIGDTVFLRVYCI